MRCKWGEGNLAYAKANKGRKIVSFNLEKNSVQKKNSTYTIDAWHGGGNPD